MRLHDRHTLSKLNFRPFLFLVPGWAGRSLAVAPACGGRLNGSVSCLRRNHKAILLKQQCVHETYVSCQGVLQRLHRGSSSDRRDCRTAVHVFTSVFITECSEYCPSEQSPVVSSLSFARLQLSGTSFLLLPVVLPLSVLLNLR